MAAGANEIVARAIGWCLADGRPEAAVDIAEAGRGLVLASVVLSGRVEEVLRGAGQHEAADAWRAGSQAGRATALNALWETTSGDSLLSTPIGEEISVTMVATRFDAVVYLVPPGRAGLRRPGRRRPRTRPAGGAGRARPAGAAGARPGRGGPAARAGRRGQQDTARRVPDRAGPSRWPSVTQLAGDADGFRGGPRGAGLGGRAGTRSAGGPTSTSWDRCWSTSAAGHSTTCRTWR